MAKNNENEVMTQEEILAMKKELEKAKAAAEAAKAAAEAQQAEAEAIKEELNAAKKEAEEAKAALEEAESAEAEPCESDPEERVPYILPKNILSDAKFHTVNLNGVNYQIQAGVRVEIPKGVAEILDHALEQRQAANELSDDLKND